MNNITPNSSSIPPQIPSPGVPVPALAPLGENPQEREPLPNVVATIESMLRQPRRVMYQLRQPGSGRVVLGMLVASICCSLIYGVVVGTFSMGEQLWAAPVKIAGGLLFAAVLCLPSLYIFTCLSGSHARLNEICGLLAGLLLLMTVLLIGFAPVAWLFSQSTESVVWMGILHLAFWLVSTLFGLRFLETGFSHTQSRSSAGLNVWIILFLLVAVQMTTALRPIVGKASSFFPTEKKFFVTHWKECWETPAAGGHN